MNRAMEDIKNGTILIPCVKLRFVSYDQKLFEALYRRLHKQSERGNDDPIVVLSDSETKDEDAMSVDGGKFEVRGSESLTLQFHRLSELEMRKCVALPDELLKQWEQR